MSCTSICVLCNSQLPEIQYDDMRCEFCQKIETMTDSELESNWQSQTSTIGQYIMASWKDNITSEESKKYRDLAEMHRNKQEVIQQEITKRGRLLN